MVDKDIPAGTQLWFHQHAAPDGWKVIARKVEYGVSLVLCEKDGEWVTIDVPSGSIAPLDPMPSLWTQEEIDRNLRSAKSDDGSPMAAVMIATDKACDKCRRKMHKSPIKLDKWYCAFCRTYKD